MSEKENHLEITEESGTRMSDKAGMYVNGEAPMNENPTTTHVQTFNCPDCSATFMKQSGLVMHRAKRCQKTTLVNEPVNEETASSFSRPSSVQKGLTYSNTGSVASGSHQSSSSKNLGPAFQEQYLQEVNESPNHDGDWGQSDDWMTPETKTKSETPYVKIEHPEDYDLPPESSKGSFVAQGFENSTHATPTPPPGFIRPPPGFKDHKPHLGFKGESHQASGGFKNGPSLQRPPGFNSPKKDQTSSRFSSDQIDRSHIQDKPDEDIRQLLKDALPCVACGDERHAQSRCRHATSGKTCGHCQQPGHLKRACFELHPELLDKLYGPLLKHKQLQAKENTCYACGSSEHLRRDCEFKDATCEFCYKQGHVRTACRRWLIRQQKLANETSEQLYSSRNSNFEPSNSQSSSSRNKKFFGVEKTENRTYRDKKEEPSQPKKVVIDHQKTFVESSNNEAAPIEGTWDTPNEETTRNEWSNNMGDGSWNTPAAATDNAWFNGTAQQNDGAWDPPYDDPSRNTTSNDHTTARAAPFCGSWDAAPSDPTAETSTNWSTVGEGDWGAHSTNVAEIEPKKELFDSSVYDPLQAKIDSYVNVNDRTTRMTETTAQGCVSKRAETMKTARSSQNNDETQGRDRRQAPSRTESTKTAETIEGYDEDDGWGSRKSTPKPPEPDLSLDIERSSLHQRRKGETPEASQSGHRNEEYAAQNVGFGQGSFNDQAQNGPSNNFDDRHRNRNRNHGYAGFVSPDNPRNRASRDSHDSESYKNGPSRNSENGRNRSSYATDDPPAEHSRHRAFPDEFYEIQVDISKARPCRACGNESHCMDDCPVPRGTVCSHCGARGHLEITCFERWNTSKEDIYAKYIFNTKMNLLTAKNCNACGQLGHRSIDCERKNKLYCFYCKTQGHLRNVCRRALFLDYIAELRRDGLIPPRKSRGDSNFEGLHQSEDQYRYRRRCRESRDFDEDEVAFDSKYDDQPQPENSNAWNATTEETWDGQNDDWESIPVNFSQRSHSKTDKKEDTSRGNDKNRYQRREYTNSSFDHGSYEDSGSSTRIRCQKNVGRKPQNSDNWSANANTNANVHVNEEWKSIEDHYDDPKNAVNSEWNMPQGNEDWDDPESSQTNKLRLNRRQETHHEDEPRTYAAWEDLSASKSGKERKSKASETNEHQDLDLERPPRASLDHSDTTPSESTEIDLGYQDTLVSEDITPTFDLPPKIKSSSPTLESYGPKFQCFNLLPPAGSTPVPKQLKKPEKIYTRLDLNGLLNYYGSAFFTQLVQENAKDAGKMWKIDKEPFELDPKKRIPINIEKMREEELRRKQEEEAKLEREKNAKIVAEIKRINEKENMVMGKVVTSDHRQLTLALEEPDWEKDFHLGRVYMDYRRYFNHEVKKQETRIASGSIDPRPRLYPRSDPTRYKAKVKNVAELSKAQFDKRLAHHEEGIKILEQEKQDRKKESEEAKEMRKAFQEEVAKRMKKDTSNEDSE